MVQRNITPVNQTQIQIPGHMQNECEHKCKVDDDILIVKNELCGIHWSHYQCCYTAKKAKVTELRLL